MMTSAGATIIQATSPLFGCGAGAADAGAAAAAVAVAAAGAAVAGVAVAAAGAAVAAEAASSAASEAPAKPRPARPRARIAMSCFMVGLPWLRRASERVLAGLARADADDLFESRDEHLAVADLAGARRLLDGLDDALDDRVVDGSLDL